MSVNKAIIIGNVGGDPEVRTFSKGGKVANFTVATSERYKTKDGEQKERTQWHKISVVNSALVDVVHKYLQKGSKIYIEGPVETRSYEKNGQKLYVTEIVLRPYNGNLQILNGRKEQSQEFYKGFDAQGDYAAPQDDLCDEVPF